MSQYTFFWRQNTGSGSTAYSSKTITNGDVNTQAQFNNRQTTIDSLVCGQTYEVYCTTLNSVGTSANSNNELYRTGSLPDQVSNVRTVLNAAATHTRIEWNNAANNGCWSITNCNLEIRTGD